MNTLRPSGCHGSLLAMLMPEAAATVAADYAVRKWGERVRAARRRPIYHALAAVHHRPVATGRERDETDVDARGGRFGPEATGRGAGRPGRRRSACRGRHDDPELPVHRHAAWHLCARPRPDLPG